MIRVMHTRCNKTAFYFKEKLNAGEPVKANNIQLLNNEPAIPNEIISCGFCHEIINFLSGELLQESWRDWFIVD